MISKNFKCNICEKTFQSLKYLNQHFTRMSDHPNKDIYWSARPNLFKEYLKRELADRYIVNNKTGCWEWRQGKKNNDYGCYNDEQAHRVFYRLYIGDIPSNLYVCHICDIPYCVNPEHLFIGTSKDNAQDMIKKGRGRMSNPNECIKHANALKGIKRPNHSIFMKNNQPMNNLETRKKVSDSLTGRTRFKYLCTSPNGLVYEVYNLKIFCKKNDLNYDCMQLVANNKISNHKNGWTCIRILKEKSEWKKDTRPMILKS